MKAEAILSTLCKSLLSLFVLLSSEIACSQDIIPFATTLSIDPSDTPDTIIAKATHVIPDHRQIEALKREFIAFACYGPNSFTRREWGTGLEDPRVFAPSSLDTDQWVRTMKDAGMTMVILTAKHHDGFVLWQSRYTNHGIMSSDFMDGKADIMRALSESCRKYGMKLGVYLSPADLHEIESPDGRYGNLSPKTLRQIPRRVEGRPFENESTFEFVVDDYNEYFLNQLFELLTEYGPIHEVWFDGAHPKRKGGQTYDYNAWKKLIYSLAPEAIIFGREGTRWCGNEAGQTRPTEWNVIPYSANPDTLTVFPDMTKSDLGSRERLMNASYLHYHPAETDVSIRDGWFYRDDESQNIRTADDVFDMYERAVGGNSILLLNIPPNRSGRLAPRDSSVIVEVGRRIKSTYLDNMLVKSDAPESLLDNDLISAVPIDGEMVISLPHKITFNRFILQEPIATSGERIERHAVDAWINGRWCELAEATNVGYKRILRFPEVTADRIRIRILASRAAPSLSSIGAYLYIKPDESDSIYHPAKPQCLSRENWVITANAESPGNIARFAIDSDSTTFWSAPAAEAVITIDIRSQKDLHGFIYTPQTDVRGLGMIARARVMTSKDGIKWQLIGESDFGNLVNDPTPRRFDFPTPVSARFMRLEVLEIEGSSPMAAIAEINLF